MSILWAPVYGLGWDHVQPPTVAGVPQPDRFQVVAGTLRVEVRAGDGNASGGCRAEVYGRSPKYMSSAKPESWPDPVGSERWYGFDVLIPQDFSLTTDTKWITLTQWKGYRGGTAPQALEIKRAGFELGGSHGRRPLGPVVRGVRTRFVFGFRWASDLAGWVEVWRDGVNVLPREQRTTMDLYAGLTDPIYLKQGIYRDSTWTVTHVVSFGPVRVGETFDDVAMGA